MNHTIRAAAAACSVALLAAACSSGGSDGAPPPSAPPNSPPRVGSVADQAFDEDSIAGPIALSVQDSDTPATMLAITATSSNPGLLPDAGIEIVGEGAERSMALLPAPGQSGTATVTLEVADGDGGVTTTAFDVTVEPLFRGEFSSWMRGVVLVQDAFDEPIGVDHADGSPLTDVENIPRIRFSDDSEGDPTAYDDLLPVPGAVLPED
jgi:hypothetical protein